MKRLLIAIFVAPFVAAAFMVIAAIVVLQWPMLIINETTLKMANRHLAPIGIGIEWQKVSIDSKSYGFLDEGLKLEFDDVCVSVKPELEKACFKKALLNFRYRFREIVPHLVSVGPVNLEGGDIQVRIPQSDEKGKKAGKKGKIAIPRMELPWWLRHAHFSLSSAQVETFEISQGDDTYRGGLTIIAMPDQDGRLIRLEVKGKANQSGKGRSADLDLAAMSPSGFVKDDWSTTHSISFNYVKDKLKGSFRLKGQLDKKALDTTLIGNLHGVSNVVTDLVLPSCVLKLVSKKMRHNKGELTLSCPVDLKIKKFKLPAEAKEIYQPPEKIRIQVSSRANTFFIPDLDQKIDGSLSVRLDPMHNRLVTTDADLEIKFSGVPSAPMESWKVESDVDVDFLIKEFSKLVKVMQDTPWPVPAPLNVLEGEVEFSLNGHMSNIAEFGRFPAKLETRLSSADQRIYIESEGEVRIGRKGGEEEADLELDVALTDVQLQLPNLSLAGLPRLTPDGRIILEEQAIDKKWESSLPFKYKAHVSTPKEKPVRILSNLTPEYVPINVDLDVENGKVDGFVKIGKFPVRMFGRKALVERLNFTLREPRENSEVEGRLSMEFPDMKVIVKIAGTIEQPLISFDSDPPVPQGDILSTLLYGEPLDQIDVDQASTVNSMNAAAADRAMALTSFFLLGSTPIQSIAYNPQTKVFSARVKLGKKTSLNVGAGEDQKSAGLKRRLGKGWSISTGVEKDDDSSNTAGTAYIEWSKRF
jgi:hypothetical protein